MTSANSKPLIEYPALYAFKVIGKRDEVFLEYIRELFGRLMGTEISQDAISVLPSSKGTYVSLTVTVQLMSEEHRRSIYLQLHQEKRILHYL